MAGRYEGRTALVTGATRGVGRVIAEHFLDEGAQVVGVARAETGLEREGYRHLPVDLADPAAIGKAFLGLHRHLDRIDIVVNNAAVLTSQYALIMPPAAAQAMVNVNLLAPFLVSREAAKFMRRSKWGRIINIGSMAASLEPVGDSVYAACKAGLSTLANVMAKEFGPMNVTCNTLAVTAFETDMLGQLPRDKIEAIIAALPAPRFATAADILNVVDFFAAEASGYITAQTLYLGGVN